MLSLFTCTYILFSAAKPHLQCCNHIHPPTVMDEVTTQDQTVLLTPVISEHLVLVIVIVIYFAFY